MAATGPCAKNQGSRHDPERSGEFCRGGGGERLGPVCRGCMKLARELGPLSSAPFVEKDSR
ncbi:MAG: hypothetical protein QM790_10285 [Nibricoccus sp.]